MVSNKEVLKFISRESKKLPESTYLVRHRELVSPIDLEKETNELVDTKQFGLIRRVLGYINGKYLVKAPQEVLHNVNHKRRLFRLWKRTHNMEDIHKYFNNYGYAFKVD